MKLAWHNTSQSVVESIYEATVADLNRLLENLEGDPSKLIFHHIFLTKDYDGPCVFVWGEEGNDHFNCEYVETPQWSKGSEP